MAAVGVVALLAAVLAGTFDRGHVLTGPALLALVVPVGHFAMMLRDRTPQRDERVAVVA